MKKSLDACHLKLIAIAAMLINHLGHTLELENQNIYLYFLTETIGRLTFPIMAYLLVEGFQYTRSRGKYALRLTLFWLLSILPFYYLFESHKPLTVDNNILYTLLLGLLLLVFLEKVQHSLLRLLLSDLAIGLGLFGNLDDCWFLRKTGGIRRLCHTNPHSYGSVYSDKSLGLLYSSQSCPALRCGCYVGPTPDSTASQSL